MKHQLPALLLVALIASPALAVHVGSWDASFQLDAAQAVPTPTRGGAFGQCVSTLQDATLTLSCTHDLEDATAAHIHLGERGVPGPVIIPLGDGASPIQGSFELTDSQVAAYLTGSTYVNVHTTANAMGEIRGQIVPRPQPGVADLFFAGDASQQTEPVDSDAVARCRAILSDATGENQLRVICSHTVADPIAAHVHRGASGVDGPPIFPFDDPVDPLDQTFTLAAGDVQDLLLGNLYVNIHTEEYPDGEVRADLIGCIETTTQMCLQGNRFAVSVVGEQPIPDEAPLPFTGRALRRTDTSGEFYFFSPDNLEVLVKVLDGCALNERFWVFFAATTDVEFDLSVTDTLTGDSRTYSNPQGNPADTIADTDAFDTCAAGAAVSP